MLTYQALAHSAFNPPHDIISRMNATMQKVSYGTQPSEREAILQTIEDAVTNPSSPINNSSHVWHEQSVRALRRLQLQMCDPSKPEISELDLMRINISSSRAEKIEQNKTLTGVATGHRPKMVTMFLGWSNHTGKPVFKSVTRSEYDKHYAETDNSLCGRCGHDEELCNCGYPED